MNKRIIGVFASVLMAAVMLFSGCSKEEGESAAVQSVAMIAGLGNVGLSDQYGGIVSARSEVKIKTDSQKKVAEVLVEEGNEVAEGQVLFTYDMELAELDMEKADLELAQMYNTLTSKQNERASLENEKAKASAADQLSYSLAIQECDADIREQQYKIAVKEKEVERLRASLEELDCKSPVSGRIKKVNSQTTESPDYGYGYQDGSDDSFITIVESGSYRVKGYINENNAAQLMEGMEVTICSRVSDETWNGHISEIDWANPQSSNSSDGAVYYGFDGGSSEMNTSNKYPFYVELDDSEGLLLGQHVYIRLGIDPEETEEVIVLPEYYLFDIDVDTAYVWAENSRQRLERRKLIVQYIEERGMYRVDAGLTAEDYIAFPSDSLKEGQPCQEFDDVIADPGMGPGMDPGMDPGMYEDGMIFPEGQEIPEGQEFPEGEFIPEDGAEIFPAEGEAMPGEEMIPGEGGVMPEGEAVPEGGVMPEGEGVPEAEAMPEANAEEGR